MRLRTVLAVAVIFVCAGGGIAQAQTEVPLGQLKKVSGEWGVLTDVTFRGRPLKVPAYSLRWQGRDGDSLEFALNEEYDAFQCEIAIDDSAPTGTQVRLFIYVDGQEASRQEIKVLDLPKALKVPIHGKARIGFRHFGGYDGFSSLPVCLVNPRVVKGTLGGGPASPQGVPSSPIASLSPTPTPSVAATFAVDPNDLQKLAEGLRKNVDEDPELKASVAGGKMAVASFSLIDIYSPAVAQNVAEDLATALIKKKFRLVERGQLDAVLKELKIQNSGLIDPKSAQEIGKLTGCTLILVGSISDRGGFVVVNARLLETATGDAVAAESVEMRKIPINR